MVQWNIEKLNLFHRLLHPIPNHRFGSLKANIDLYLSYLKTWTYLSPYETEWKFKKRFEQTFFKDSEYTPFSSRLDKLSVSSHTIELNLRHFICDNCLSKSRSANWHYDNNHWCSFSFWLPMTDTLKKLVDYLLFS